MQDFDSDVIKPGQAGAYQSISKRSYKDLSSLNKGQKIHSVHEKKIRDPKKVGFLEHFEGLDDGDFLKSVQKKGNTTEKYISNSCIPSWLRFWMEG